MQREGGVSVTVETNLFFADFIVTSFKPTWTRQAKHSYAESLVLSVSKGTITTPASNGVLLTAKSKVAERERDRQLRITSRRAPL